MIPYVEVRDKYSRLPFASIVPAECWFELFFYGAGEFEVYTKATPAALEALKEDNYITLPHLPYIWVIESVNPTFEAGRGHMISAKGRQAKIILNKRIIKRQTQLPSDLTSAVFDLIYNNAGGAAGSLRKIDGLETLESVVVQPITETQVSYSPLMEYTDALAQAYEVGAELTITDAAAFSYRLYTGVDRSASIIFSQTFDNLISSSYKRDKTNYKTYALIGGEGEGAARILEEYDTAPSARGIDRVEMFVDAKDISSKYTDANGEQKELDLTTAAGLSTYKKWLRERGKTKIGESVQIEAFEGVIDTQNSAHKFGTDFYLGDRVRVQDDFLGVYITPRILKFTMRQDRNYSELVEYGG